MRDAATQRATKRKRREPTGGNQKQLTECSERMLAERRANKNTRSAKDKRSRTRNNQQRQQKRMLADLRGKTDDESQPAKPNARKDPTQPSSTGPITQRCRKQTTKHQCTSECRGVQKKPALAQAAPTVAASMNGRPRIEPPL